MVNKSGMLTGREILTFLELEAPRELKKTRQYVEEAVELDISAYLKNFGIKDVPQSILGGLVTAAVAGGQWGFDNLVTRMGSADFKLKDIELAANEILSLISRHTSVLNYARIRATAVQSMIKSLLSVDKTSKNFSDFDKLFKTSIKDEISLENWGIEAENLFQSIVVSAGQVSQRSVSTYSKLWKTFLEEKISPKLSLDFNLKNLDTVSQRSKYLFQYTELTSSKVRKYIKESERKTSFKSSLSNKDNDSINSKSISYQVNLNGRNLKIIYNSPGVDPELIQPVLNSIKGQLIANPKQQSLSVNMSTDISRILVELEKPKKEDIDTIKIHLGSLVIHS